MIDDVSVEEFRAAVLDHYAEAGRRLPWRETRDPWLVLLSEVMLQQTRTDRVVAYWEKWRRLWPDPASLAAASLEDVLRAWSGLGYNRRARALRDAAAAIRDRHGGRVPSSIPDLEALPGIGPYTARAVACFAFGSAEPFIETNIRAAALHFFFPGREGVKDAEILPVLARAVDRSDPRRWHQALMDYGAALKKMAPNPSRRSAHYARQSAFEGSLRQARGAILRSLAADGPAAVADLVLRAGLGADRLEPALASLAAEGFVAEAGGVYRVAD